MDIHENVPLALHSTMRLGGPARYLMDVTDRSDIREAYAWAAHQGLPVLMVGYGSNIVWRDEGFAGLVLVNKIKRFELFDEDETNTYLTAGAGEVWDDVVARSVEHGLTGIEALSLIPGTVGATPVQNVGAYGQDVSQTIVSIEAYDTTLKSFTTIPVAACAFGYRTSRFKTPEHGRFFITAVTFHLQRANPEPPFYGALTKYFEDHHITDFTPLAVRQAVCDIRRRKLPDPAEIANNGSFFANPIIDIGVFTQIQAFYPDAPHWTTSDERLVKLPAAWLIEQAGFKGVHDTETGMATWADQPLVLINETAHSTAQLLAFKQKIVSAVHAKFNITLQQEPELFPAQPVPSA